MDRWPHAPLRRSTRLPSALFDRLLAACLAACKDSALGDALAERAHLAARICPPLVALVNSTLGDDPEVSTPWRAAAALRAFLGWAMCALRPDGRNDWAEVPVEGWVSRTSWRPALALACHHGFVPVPAIAGRFLGSANDTVANRLCTLWDVGPSTYYRYLEKGRHRLAARLAETVLGAHETVSFRAYLQTMEQRLACADCEGGWLAWHARQERTAREAGDFGAALWHAVQAANGVVLVALLSSHATELARLPDTPLLLQRVDSSALPFPLVVDWHLACADVARCRGDAVQERQCIERALELALGHGAAQHTSRALLALGDYHQSRDADRALAHYQEAADRMARLGECEEGADMRVQCLNRLAWALALKNDPRAHGLLLEADARSHNAAVAERTRGFLAMTWGEYWGRAGEAGKELEHKHRALVIFEAAGDRRNVHCACSNLSIAYSRHGAFDKAIHYADRLLEARADAPIETMLVVCALGNKGSAEFYRGRHSEAIACYQEGLRISQQAQMDVEACGMHFNLAEAYLKRYEASGDPADRVAGERHAELTLRSEAARGQPYLQEAARALIPREGEGEGIEVFSLARLVPDDHAMHAEQMALVQHHRQLLAGPAKPESRARSHLELARAYLIIAAQERDRAMTVIHEQGLEGAFGAELEALRRTFDRQLTREQRVLAQWREQAGLVLAESRRIAVLEHLFAHGSIQKSGYARLCGVGLATASKHLSTLSELGLLEQMGRGPATRYQLAARDG